MMSKKKQSFLIDRQMNQCWNGFLYYCIEVLALGTSNWVKQQSSFYESDYSLTEAGYHAC